MTQTKSVLVEIIERLAALKPEQFIEPDMQPEVDYHAVGEASEDIKRLFTLRNIACDEYNTLAKPLAATVEKIRQEVKRAKTNKDTVEALQAIVALEDDPEMLRLEAEMARKRNFHDIVDKIFWLELRRQYRELDEKPSIGVRKNWTVGWFEEKDETEALGDIFGTKDELGGLSGFLEFLHSRAR